MRPLGSFWALRSKALVSLSPHQSLGSEHAKRPPESLRPRFSLWPNRPSVSLYACSRRSLHTLDPRRPHRTLDSYRPGALESCPLSSLRPLRALGAGRPRRSLGALRTLNARGPLHSLGALISLRTAQPLKAVGP